MKLKWYGHASFRITAQDGTSIITDPYNPATSGYKPFAEAADIVVMSSDNDSFHCNENLVPGDHLTIDALELARTGGECVDRGIRFRAIEAMEARNHNEHDPDQNGMYRMTVDGLEIGHMGDIGNALTDAQLEFFDGLDVLLALTGGHPTLELDDLKTMIDRVKPGLVVPMHFRTLSYRPRNTLWIESFLAYFPDSSVDFACDCEVELTRADIPTETRVLVLDHA